MNNTLRYSLLSGIIGIAGSLHTVSAYTSTADSSLLQELSMMKIPLVVVNTVDGEEPSCDGIDAPPGQWGAGITNVTKVPASMQIILEGDTLYDSGEYVKKESGLTIKIRGNTSGTKPKKPYKLKLQKKADLLFRGDKKYKDKDWVLLRTGNTLITPIGNWAGELVGQEWTPSCRHVNMVMNGTYRGLYVLCEQLTVNPECRIDVDEKDGYVVEADAYWWNEDISFPSTLTAPQLQFTYKYPDPEDLTEEWHEAISADVIAHEAKISDATYDEAYDCESFAKWLVAWELLGNDDAAGANMYIVKKDADSKICMGPMWDFDRGMNLEGDWIGIHYKNFYFHHMLNSSNPAFRNAFTSLWKEKGREVADGIIDRINAFAASEEASDYQRSIDIENELDFPYDWWQPYLGSLEYMRTYCTEFISRRADWIDAKMSEESGVDAFGSSTERDNVNAYDVLGRPVSPDTPGLQIRDGRKVFVKP